MLSMLELTHRIQLLKEGLFNLVHTKYREVRDLTIFGDAEIEKRPLVIWKALGLSLLLDKTPAVILNEELLVGVRTIYGSLTDAQYVTYGPIDVSETNFHRRYFPHYMIEKELEDAIKIGNFPTYHQPSARALSTVKEMIMNDR